MPGRASFSKGLNRSYMGESMPAIEFSENEIKF